MARFVACKWPPGATSWEIILRDRSAAGLAAAADRWMVDNEATEPPTVIGYVRIPPGADVEGYIADLPPPGSHFHDCPLCRSNKPHTIH